MIFLAVNLIPIILAFDQIQIKYYFCNKKSFIIHLKIQNMNLYIPND